MRTYPNFAVAQPLAWPRYPGFRAVARRHEAILPAGWWVMPSLFAGLGLWWALITAL